MAVITYAGAIAPRARARANTYVIRNSEGSSGNRVIILRRNISLDCGCYWRAILRTMWRVCTRPCTPSVSERCRALRPWTLWVEFLLFTARQPAMIDGMTPCDREQRRDRVSSRNHRPRHARVRRRSSRNPLLIAQRSRVRSSSRSLFILCYPIRQNYWSRISDVLLVTGSCHRRWLSAIPKVTRVSEMTASRIMRSDVWAMNRGEGGFMLMEI